MKSSNPKRNQGADHPRRVHHAGSRLTFCMTNTVGATAYPIFPANCSGKSLRYREAVELADVLGYDVVWQKRR